MQKSIAVISLAAALAGAALAQPRASADAATGAGIGPCEDFYRYACGTWMVEHPIPKEESSWGRFQEIRESNAVAMRDILEQTRPAAENRTRVAAEIGDYYESCMNTNGIAKRGTAALEDQMKRIDTIDSARTLLAELAILHKQGIDAFWTFSSEPDYENSSVVIADLSPGGLTLPGRPYYVRKDERTAAIRAKLEEYITAMFGLAGDAPERAREEARTVVRLETRLADKTLEREEQIDPRNIAHKVTVEKLAEMVPHFDWPAYFHAMDAPPFRELNVQVPAYLASVDAVLAGTEWSEIKIYLRWRLLADSANELPEGFVTRTFELFGKVLRGAQEQKPRWRRCSEFADSQLGEALGQEYVARRFSPEAKASMLRLVRELETSLGQDLRELPWMTETTRAQAVLKLKKLTGKIGYPDNWIDYSAASIRRDDFLGNYQRLNSFERARELAKIGKPVDRLEWEMTPPTVNAYYQPFENNINFPAGILQPPFFTPGGDDAENLGAIGIIVGHELTHGFDNNGRRFDENGNLRDWWSARDDEAFQDRAECLVKEYGSFDYAPGLKGNGKLTLGENIADNGGMRIAHMTLLRLLAEKGAAPGESKYSEFTPQQRFFLAYGRSSCQNTREETARHLALTDEHSPPEWRVNGTLANMPEFQEAFACKVGAPMVRRLACKVW